jgi:membrane protein implicated in regulation of membrane protease activity
MDPNFLTATIGRISPLAAFLLIALFAALLAALVAAASRCKKNVVGELDLIGRIAIVEESLEPEGAVLVDGELWRSGARQEVPLPRGTRVRIVGARRHLLLVEPIDGRLGPKP